MKSAKTFDDTKSQFLSFYREHSRLPSYSEICQIFGYKSKNAAFRLVKKLIDVGVIAKSTGGRLVPKSLTQSLKVLGTVQAGFPSPAEEALLDTISLDSFLIRNPQSSFMLRVTGDSMIDEGIMPKDLVIIERGRTPKNNDVVLAQIDGDWTLKFYSNHNGQVKLIPGNKNYPVMIPKQELKVAGVVVGVVRRYM